MFTSQTAETDPIPGRRVLLAEDDAAMRTLLACRLRRAGFQVTEASNGAEALERLTQEWADAPMIAFNVIVSDVHMPGYDGLNILASLRQTGAYVPVILITAFGTLATHVLAARLGAYAILDKPFDIDDLVSRVSAAAHAEARPPPAGDRG